VLAGVWLKVKGPDIYFLYRYRRLKGNPNGIGLQLEVAHWPALAVGGAAQSTAVHCPKERIFDPQSAARQTHLCPSQPHYDLHPTMFSGNVLF